MLRLLQLSAVALSLLAQAVCGQTEGSPQELLVQLYRASGVTRPCPELKIAESGQGASYNTATNTITLDEQLLPFLGSIYGENAKAAIALILAHELGHFFWQHDWSASFGASYADLLVGESAFHVSSVQQALYAEGQADYTAAWLCHLADIDISAVAGTLYPQMYARFGLQDNPRYPKLEERQTIINTAVARAGDNALIFRAATLLLVSGRFEEAAQCFLHIAGTFPSPEILNNAGVAVLQGGLNRGNRAMFAEIPSMRFVLPLAFDTENRFLKSGLPGITFSNNPRLIRVLKASVARARELFDRARMNDPDYVLSYINLSCALSLENSYLLALGYANEASSRMRGTSNPLLGNAHVAEGIASAGLSSLESAAESFTRAQSFREELAGKNLLIIEKIMAGVKDPQEFNVPHSEKPILDVVSIGGISPNSKQIHELQGSGRRTATLHGDGWRMEIAGRIAAGAPSVAGVDVLSVSRPPYRINFVTARQGYQGSPFHGIQLGSSKGDVREQYGDPEFSTSAQDSTFSCYPWSGSVFEFNTEGKVVSFTAFAVVFP